MPIIKCDRNSHLALFSIQAAQLRQKPAFRVSHKVATIKKYFRAIAISVSVVKSNTHHHLS